MSDDDAKYPDLKPDDGPVLNLPTNGKAARPILWGHTYKSWSDETKIAYLEKLASSLNGALGDMQADRNRLSAIAFKQAAQLQQAAQRLQAQHELFQRQITTWNADKERRLTKIVSLQAQVGEQAKRLKGG